MDSNCTVNVHDPHGANMHAAVGVTELPKEKSNDMLLHVCL